MRERSPRLHRAAHRAADRLGNWCPGRKDRDLDPRLFACVHFLRFDVIVAMEDKPMQQELHLNDPAASYGRFVSHLTRSAFAIVLAGGRGSRLMQLTDWRSKPAVPFGGKFRI